MAFKEVNDLSPDTVVSLGGVNKKTGKKNPTGIEGYFVGKRKVDDKKKKSGFSYIYVFQTAKGNVGVWGKTDLDRKMSATETGTMTRITLTGTRPTPNGDMYVFKVEIDPDNTIEVLAGSDDDSNSESESEESEAASEDDAEDDAELFAAPALPTGNANLNLATNDAAARKAKVQALLSKKSK